MVRKCVVASGVLIEDGNVLLIRHEKLGVWIYPGGHVEPDETPSEAVVREFREETGLDVAPVGRLQRVGSGEAVDEVLPIAILREIVRYPTETHIHYDLIFRVKRVGGELRNGKWFSVSEVDSIETYENVRNVIKLAAGELP
ncbi:MAG: NUDIX hydrolase [Acidilobus sp.]